VYFLNGYTIIPPILKIRVNTIFKLKITHRKVSSSNTSHLEAHAEFFRLLITGIFDPYVL